MNFNIAITIALFLLGVGSYLRAIAKGKEENGTSNTLITTGLTLILSGSPEIIDIVTELLANLLNFNITGNEGSYYFRALLGLFLVIVGLISKYKLKERIFIFNMYGLAVKKDIDQENALKDLKFAEYKVKETIVDFVELFQTKPIMNSDKNKAICNHVKSTADRFAARVEGEQKVCFTGMAPIPYTVYAGTCLAGTNVTHYLEYNSKDNGHYYSLANSKKKKNKSHKSWDVIKVEFQSNIDADATEVVLAISITRKVKVEDLVQFSSDVVKVEIDNPADNIIRSSQQLDDYIQFIYDCIENKIQDKYPNVKTIHIAASIPSCVSLALGKELELRKNRVSDIVVHHYINRNTPRYAFGIYVNGTSKGKLWKEQED